MRPLTFSTAYPSYHPRKGQPTDFVGKIWKGLHDEPDDALFSHDIAGYWSVYVEIQNQLTPKYHTIRAGKRWKAGDWFKPVIWGTDINPKSGRSGPYQSKQIQFAPPIQIVKVWDYEVKTEKESHYHLVDGVTVCSSFEVTEVHSVWTGESALEEISANDGLSLADFLAWFKHPAPFSGQIICWSDKIEY